MASVVQANGRIVHRGARAALAAWFLLAATGFAHAAASVVPTAANNSQKHPGVACPSQQFKVFLEAFAESPKLQKAFIKFPLQYRKTGFNSEVSTRIVGSYAELMKDIAGAGPFPNRKERKSEKLFMKILRNPPVEMKGNPGDVIVNVGVPDSDVGDLYYFQRTNSCWQLYIIEDYTP